jgi:hypothetical protein
MRTIKWAAAPRSWRRFVQAGLVLIAAHSASSVAAQQPGRQSLENDIAIAQMHKLAGRVLAQGKNEQPAGDLKLRTYLVEEVNLARPLQVEISGLKTEVSRGWRVTITGGPFVVRAMPAMVWIDNVLLGYGVESPDLQRISVITFERSLLRDGASIALSYGEGRSISYRTSRTTALPGNRRGDLVMKRTARIVSSLIVLGLFLCDAGSQAAYCQDPSLPGAFAVTREEYDFGDTAFTPPGFPGPVEIRGSVHYPTSWTGAPLPLILFLHGRHGVCFQGTSGGPFEWPCTPPNQPIPSYKGYDYISQILASNGYLVVSISANGINAVDNTTSDFGALARARLIQEHLNRWATFNTVGGAPFGTKFVGKINMQRIGTRAVRGEGACRPLLLNQSLGSPYGIKAVFALAPVDFSRFVINNVPLAVLLPYCDGDVRDLQGVHFYDDARYNVPGDLAAKHSILVLGANHNFYNTIWTPGGFPASTSDDWLGFIPSGSTDPHCGTGAGNGRLTDAQERATALVYLSAFLRVYVGGETQFLPLLTGAAAPPASAGTSLFVSYHAPDTPNCAGM